MTYNNLHSFQRYDPRIAIKGRCFAALKCSVKIFLISVLVGNAAFAQTKKGTIGVVSFTKDKIAAAIDSHAMADIGPPSNSECKITAFDDEVIFLVSGVAVRTKGTSTWSAMQEAKNAHQIISGQPIPNDGKAAQMAATWGALMLERFLAWNKEDPVDVVRHVQDRALTRAYFAGRNSKKALVLWEVIITYDPKKTNPLDRFVHEITCARGICAIGRVEVVFELVYADSESAHAEAAEWEKVAAQFSVENRPIQRVIRLVELTISRRKAAGFDDVGGPIDAVELLRDGGVKWYARKCNCADN